MMLAIISRYEEIGAVSGIPCTTQTTLELAVQGLSNDRVKAPQLRPELLNRLELIDVVGSANPIELLIITHLFKRQPKPAQQSRQSWLHQCKRVLPLDKPDHGG
ncbi:hypothetical protein GCM10009038_15590 [Salinicola rhizosphaerae]|uniref:Uncharacterized protein n=1 Tax=Salinicola rhizosphaerae TaxID=1443141 RepID=A0ABQ3DVI6_9GAMM|nr:hypothetical protein GCM10009038_15590 [Salinicola rhizosphaerae]